MKIMNSDFLPHFEQKIRTFYAETFEKLIKGQNNIQNYDDLIACWHKLHNAYLATTATMLQRWAEEYHVEKTNSLDKIEANSVVVEVVDEHTGKLFRRNLPLNYLENSNGVILSGETPEGKPSQIVFLSESAINKINDLMGKGPNSPQCKD